MREHLSNSLREEGGLREPLGGGTFEFVAGTPSKQGLPWSLGSTGVSTQLPLGREGRLDPLVHVKAGMAREEHAQRVTYCLVTTQQPLRNSYTWNLPILVQQVRVHQGVAEAIREEFMQNVLLQEQMIHELSEKLEAMEEAVEGLEPLSIRPSLEEEGIFFFHSFLANSRFSTPSVCVV